MTILQIKDLIDDAIQAVTQEVSAAALVPPFTQYPSKVYSDLFKTRLMEELATVPDDPAVSDFRIYRDFIPCRIEAVIFIEFTYDEDLLDDEVPLHRVRYEAVDYFFPTTKSGDC